MDDLALSPAGLLPPRGPWRDERYASKPFKSSNCIVSMERKGEKTKEKPEEVPNRQCRSGQFEGEENAHHATAGWTRA